jgi:hypothetical protein
MVSCNNLEARNLSKGALCPFFYGHSNSEVGFLLPMFVQGLSKGNAIEA